MTTSPTWLPRFVTRHSIRSKSAVATLVVAGIVAISGVTVGAIEVFTHATPNHNGTNTLWGTWRTPHWELGAPVVPSSGGAINGSGSFNSVSCPSATTCVAVGATGSLVGVASTSTDGGSTWVQGVTDKNEPELNAVDCASTTTCVAVGEGAAVQSSDGGNTWTSQTIPTPNTTLLGVNCPTTKLCVSVGVSPATTGPYNGQLLLSSNGGTTWTVPTLPSSLGALGSVTCPTSQFCVAVGASIVETYNGGKTWTTKTVNGGTAVLRSVSCQSARVCVAVGANPEIAQNPNVPAFAVETTNGGTTWNAVNLPAGSGTLDVVACSSTNCSAAGSSFDGFAAPVLTSGDGSSWSGDTSVPPLSGVSGLSCFTGSSCVFVGKSGSSPVSIATNNGVPVTQRPVGFFVRHQKDHLT